jgi:cysteine desulfurase / selenocysteine lyase
MMPPEPNSLAGILTFTLPELERIQAYLLSKNVHVMHRAGRLRVSVHLYNIAEDIERLLSATREALNRV